MSIVTKRDYTFGAEFAYDEDRKQQVVIFYTWDTVLREGIVTYAKVLGITDEEVYSTVFSNLSNIGVS